MMQMYLKVFETALKKDLVSVDFIKKSEISELIYRHIIKDDGLQVCHKQAKSILTLLELK